MGSLQIATEDVRHLIAATGRLRLCLRGGCDRAWPGDLQKGFSFPTRSTRALPNIRQTLRVLEAS